MYGTNLCCISKVIRVGNYEKSFEVLPPEKHSKYTVEIGQEEEMSDGYELLIVYSLQLLMSGIFLQVS